MVVVEAKLFFLLREIFEVSSTKQPTQISNNEGVMLGVFMLDFNLEVLSFDFEKSPKEYMELIEEHQGTPRKGFIILVLVEFELKPSVRTLPTH